MNARKICGFVCAVPHDHRNLDLALLLIRLSLGAIFIAHGWAKVSNIDGAIAMFASMGIGTMLTYVAAYTELLGGIAILLGVATRLAGGLLSVVMVVAIALVHFKNGFDMANGGYEYQLLILVCAIAIAIVGPGKYSLHDKWCKKMY